MDVFGLLFDKVEEAVRSLLRRQPVGNDLATCLIDSLKTSLSPALSPRLEVEGREDAGLHRSARQAILDSKDEFGNTMLLLAAWNNKPDMYDRLVQMGATADIRNTDGLTPFSLTARHGMWDMFHHIWDRHMRQVAWRFGNVERTTTEYMIFDWKGLVSFESRSEAKTCMELLIWLYANHINRHSSDPTFSESWKSSGS